MVNPPASLVKSFWIGPSTAANTGVPRGARMSIAWCRWPARPSLNEGRNCPAVTPATGMMIAAGSMPGPRSWSGCDPSTRAVVDPTVTASCLAGSWPRANAVRAISTSTARIIQRMTGDNRFLMPELPDVTVYIEALQARLAGATMLKLRLANPFVLRTVEPVPQSLAGKRVHSIERVGKRIVFGFDDDLFLIIHLMIAGRFRWLPANAKIPGKLGLAAFDFDAGTLVLTEAGSKRRASIHIVQGREAVRAQDPGGIEVLEATLDA